MSEFSTPVASYCCIQGGMVEVLLSIQLFITASMLAMIFNS